MTEEVSLQLLHQRIRNRIIEQLELLAEGDDHPLRNGADEYFEAFFDWMPIEDREPLRNVVMTTEELLAIERVRSLMLKACEATPERGTARDLIASGWPAHIAGTAATALEALEARGRFSESVEEVSDTSSRHT